MKKTTYNYRLLISFLILVWFTKTKAQNYTPEEHEKSANEFEIRGQMFQAADLYVMAAIKYENKAALLDDTKVSARKIERYSYILKAKKLFAKAAIHYRSCYKLDKADYATQKVAYLDMKIALEGLESLGYNDKNDKKNDDDKNKTPPPTRAKIIYEPGDHVYFPCKKAKFRITPPLAMKNIGAREFIQDSTKKEFYTKTSFGIIVLDNVYSINVGMAEHLNDYNKNGQTNQQRCEDMAKSYQKTIDELPNKKLADELALDLKKIIKTIDIGYGTKACLTMEEQKIAFQTDTGIYFTISFELNKNSYILSGSGPVNWKDAMLKMLNSFVILDTGEYLNCTKGEFQELKNQAFHDYYKLPVQNRPVKITITPLLPRDKVPDAWHAYIDYVRKGVEKIAGIEWEEDKTLEEAKKIIFYLNKLGFEEITPGRVADAYLAVMDKMITGVQGIEMKVTNMGLNYKCEINYNMVHASCIPHVVCVNNKYVPDYQQMTYKEIDKSKGKETIERGPLTLMGIQQLEETLVKRALNAMQYDLKMYNDVDRCARHQGDLRMMDFGIMPDVCLRTTARWNYMTNEMELAKKDSIRFKNELSDFGNLKPKKVATLNQQIDSLNKRINEAVERIKKANTTLNQYKNSGTQNSSTDAQILKQQELINKLESDLAFMKESRLEHTNALDRINRKVELEISAKITSISERMTDLRKQMAKVKPEFDKCNK